MEKGDKKKVKPKKKTQQKQKQKQEQNVIVNITQPVKKQRKRVYEKLGRQKSSYVRHKKKVEAEIMDCRR